MAAPGADSEPEVHLEPDVEELWSSRALLLVLLLLIFSFWISYYLKTRRIKTVHETLVALFLGMVIGFIVSKTPGEVVQSMISFKNTIMLNVLLPPIILASGYDLKEENFFRNFGVILTFAFCGTFISAVVIGTLVYIWALLGLERLSLGIVECLLFGSTLSATDPVTVLAIFNTLKVDPKLYSIIFGESLLNDAVAIVMFETLSQFHGEKVHIFSFFHGVGIFLLVFFTSMALGVLFGLSCSLLLKHSNVGHFAEIEACLVLLIAYTSYFFSNAVTMSGIVSLLFCGITLKHYAYHNMSRRTQRTTKYMFKTLSSLAENFIFIYLGLSLFTQSKLVYKPLFIIVTGLAICVARYCAVFPISHVINVFFQKARGARTEELPHSYQMMLFWAGLRGAVGVALAAGIKGQNAVALRTTVLVAVVMTMVVFGGTTTRMIEIVGIRTGIDDGEDDSSDDEAGLTLARGGRNYPELNGGNGAKHTLGEQLGMASPTDTPYNHHRNPRPSTSATQFHTNSSEVSLASMDSDDEVLPAAPGPGLEEGDGAGTARVWRDGQWFNVLDERYLLPVFSNATASRKQASRKALRSSSRRSVVDGGGGPGAEADLGSPSPSAPSSPWLEGPSDGSAGAPSRFHAPPPHGSSFGTAISSLLYNPLPSPATSYAVATSGLSSHKKRGSDDRLSRPIPENDGTFYDGSAPVAGGSVSAASEESTAGGRHSAGGTSISILPDQSTRPRSAVASGSASPGSLSPTPWEGRSAFVGHRSSSSASSAPPHGNTR